jgi:hypothetical protein
MKSAILFFVALWSSTALAASLSYGEAKGFADRDEASLGSAGQSLVEAQGQVGGPILGACGAQDRAVDLSPFVVVMELDARGKIVRTWRKGDSRIAICFEQGMNGKTLVVPPRSPFYTSFDMTFQP